MRRRRAAIRADRGQHLAGEDAAVGRALGAGDDPHHDLVAVAGVVAACFLLSVAQRRLSTPARRLRRRTVALRGEQRLDDGTQIELDAAAVAAPLEGTLRALSLALPALAIALIVVRA